MYAPEIIAFTDLLHAYYAHELNRKSPEQWREIAAYAREPLAERCLAVRTAIEQIARADDAEIEDMKYCFNALFVGPEKLLAAPYETVYASQERVLMRQTTLSVREAYGEFGMQPDRKNTEPDDHFAYEFAFLSLLLRQGDAKAEEAYRRFVANHLGIWVPAHAKAVRENTANIVCIGFANLLEAVYAECAR